VAARAPSRNRVACPGRRELESIEGTR
jgi:hypothetical protein